MDRAPVGGVGETDFMHDATGRGGDTKQLKRLNRDLQSISQLPLFIAVDQEGGSVARIQEDSKTNISQRFLQDEEQIYDTLYRGLKCLKNWV